ASNGTESSGAPSLTKWFRPSMCVPAWQHKSILETLQTAPWFISAKRSIFTGGSVGQCTMPLCSGTEISIHVLFIDHCSREKTQKTQSDFRPGRAYFSERGCVRSTRRSRLQYRGATDSFARVSPERGCCGWSFGHSRAPLAAARLP